MLWYIRRNVITHGTDYNALKYKHEHDYVWDDYKAFKYKHELEYDYAWGWNEILKAEYVRGYCVKIVKISLG